jgi:hypothetical protein
VIVVAKDVPYWQQGLDIPRALTGAALVTAQVEELGDKLRYLIDNDPEFAVLYAEAEAECAADEPGPQIQLGLFAVAERRVR